MESYLRIVEVVLTDNIKWFSYNITACPIKVSICLLKYLNLLIQTPGTIGDGGPWFLVIPLFSVAYATENQQFALKYEVQKSVICALHALLMALIMEKL